MVVDRGTNAMMNIVRKSRNILTASLEPGSEGDLRRTPRKASAFLRRRLCCTLRLTLCCSLCCTLCCMAAIAGLLGMASAARAQGSRKDDIVFNAQGRPMAGANVRICAASATGQPCTPLANIYSDSALTQALANPTSTDGLGNYSFYAAPGRYMIEINGPGITTKQVPNVILPNDPSAPTFASLTTTSGISAFSLSLSGNLTVTGSTAVTGALTVGGAAVPSTGQANTWSAAQTFSQDVISGSGTPWTDVRANGARCDSFTDATTGVINTVSNLTASGGTAFLPHGCKITPPTTLPANSFYTRIGLGGQLNTTSTLHLSPGYSLECLNPSVSANYGGAGDTAYQTPNCNVLESPQYSFTGPTISIDEAGAYLKNITTTYFCGMGIVAPTNGNNIRLDNVVSSGVNCITGHPSTGAGGYEQNNGFSTLIQNGEFDSSPGGGSSALPSIWWHSTSAQDAPGSITTIEHSAMQQHGMLFDTSGGGCASSNVSSNFRSIQQLYESANSQGHVPSDPYTAFATYDVAHCTYIRQLYDSTEVADATGGAPLISVINSAQNNASTGLYGAVVINPGGYSDMFDDVPYATKSGYNGSIFDSFIVNPANDNPLGLVGNDCSYFAFIAGSQVNCNSQTNLPTADVGGHVIAMVGPAQMSCSASPTGGSITAATYWILPVPMGINAAGNPAQGTPGSEMVVTTTGSTSTITCTDSNPVNMYPPGATGMRFYIGPNGSLQENLYYSAPNGSSFTMTGPGYTVGAPDQIGSAPTATSLAVTDFLNATGNEFVAGSGGNFGIGIRTPTHKLHVAGDAAINIGGFDGIFTHANTANRTYTLPDQAGTVALNLSAGATLTYTAIAAQTCQEQTVHVTGATTSQVAAASPSASLGNVNLSWSAWVSATNTVSVRVCNPSSGSITPSAVMWQARVLQ